jgi:hypothetical protein
VEYASGGEGEASMRKQRPPTTGNAEDVTKLSGNSYALRRNREVWERRERERSTTEIPKATRKSLRSRNRTTWTYQMRFRVTYASQQTLEDPGKNCIFTKDELRMLLQDQCQAED